MPTVPSVLTGLVDFVEPRLGRAARVVLVEDLAAGLRRVRLAGPALRGLPFRAGMEIEVRVEATAFRHYTPSAYDVSDGSLDVVFHLHGAGPGARWAAGLANGRDVIVLGPGGNLRLAGTSTHVFLGDETCLGLFAVLAAAAPPTARVLGAVEVERGAAAWPRLVGAPVEGIVRVPVQRGAALLAWLRANADLPRDTTFYLAGHAGSIATLRDELRARGWARGAIKTKPYWADGKRGL